MKAFPPGRTILVFSLAADLTPLGSVGTGPGTLPGGACSDGVNLWITLQTIPGQLVRF